MFQRLKIEDPENDDLENYDSVEAYRREINLRLSNGEDIRQIDVTDYIPAPDDYDDAC